MKSFRNPVILIGFAEETYWNFFFFGGGSLTWILKTRDFLETHSSYWNGDANCSYYNLTVMLYLVELSSAEWDLRSHSGLASVGN